MSHSFNSEVQDLLIELIDSVDGGHGGPGLAGKKGGNSPFLLPEGIYPHHLTLEELQYFSKFLCDAVICSGHQLPDHFMYWGWTASIILGNPSAGEFEHPLHKYNRLDIRDLIHLAYLPEWEGQMTHMTMTREVDFDDPFVRWVKDRFPGWGMGYRMTAKMGFSLLEGLLRRHCEQLTPKGELTGTDSKFDEYLPPWQSVNDDETRVLYYDTLRLWKDHNATPAVEEALNEIDDMDSPDNPLPSYRDQLGIGPEKIEVDYDFVNDESFLRLLKELRNRDFHGEREATDGPSAQGVTMTLSIILVTLCCLIFWDGLSKSDYQQRKKDVAYGRWAATNMSGEIYYPWYDEEEPPNDYEH